jgi:hypothetical protein
MITWVRLLPYATGLILIISALSYEHHRGYTAGKSVVQARFDAYVKAQEAYVKAQEAYVKAQEALVIKAYQEADAKEAAAKVTNETALADYQRQLANSYTYSNFLKQRLRDAIAQASGRPVPPGSDQPATAGSAPTPSATGIGERIGDAIVECRDNEQQLQSLLDELNPQL